MKNKNIPTAYNPQKVEGKIYKMWESSGYFNPDKLPNQKSRKKVFSIAMPPPNATGILHMGHAVMLAIQDAEVRYHRMKDEKTLWLPGTDHASIATQNVVEKLLLKQDIKKEDIGREKFLKEINRFVAKSKNTIKTQVKKMGSSCDWSRERYTLDAGLSEAVATVFVSMYRDGLVYKGWRMVNWCPRCVSTLADDEVDHKEVNGNLYYIKYPIKEGGSLTVATTRPETMLGDTALMVNPNDERYKEYVGKVSQMPLTKREIPVLADEYVDASFGTGVLKITPGHDPNDFKLGKKHKLDMIDIFDNCGKVDEKQASYYNFKKYAGLDRFEARKKIVEDLKSEGFLVKIEPHKHNVGHCYRCGTVVEPKVSQQWFVAVNKKLKNGKSLKQKAVEAVKSKKVKIVPERFNKTYFHWMNNLDDWCISRQIWFGHRLPVYYCDACENVMVETKKPSQCQKCDSKKIRREEDTLDTWFSSGLWTFSTLGWPEKTKDLETFHPTSLMETGYDILFFWVARMIIMSEYALNTIPFKTVYLHGLVRDKNGVKMSKSLGNVIDPLEMSQKYGADATRLSLIIGNSPGNDLKLSEEKIASFRNFSNKIWNVSRYVILNSKSHPALPPTLKLRRAGKLRMASKKLDLKKLTAADKWILAKLEQLKKDLQNHYEKIELSPAGEKLREFIWQDLADWYIEIAKTQRNDVLKYILKEVLILSHPLLPFLTEHIWEVAGFKKNKNDLLMIQQFPEAKLKINIKKAEQDFELIKNIIVSARNIKQEYKVEPKQKVPATVYSKNHKVIKETQGGILLLAGLSEIHIAPSVKKPADSAQAIGKEFSLYIPLSGLVDKEKETARMKKELEESEKYRDSLSQKLANEEFLKKAPPQIVAQIREKLNEQEKKIKELENKINV